MAKRKIPLDDFRSRNKEIGKELRETKKAINAEWRSRKSRKGLT